MNFATGWKSEVLQKELPHYQILLQNGPVCFWQETSTKLKGP